MLAERPGQRFFVDDRSARGVDEIRRSLHPCERATIDQVPRGRREGRVNRDDIRADEQLVERQLRQVRRRTPVSRREDGLHAKGGRAGRDGSANPAAADDAELLAAELHAQHEVQRPALPAASPHQPLAFRQPPRHRQNQRPREFRGRLREHVRCVRDDDPARLRGGDVDVVVAHGDVRDDFQIGCATHHVCRDGVGQDAHQPLLPLQAADELVGRQRRGPVIQLDAAAGLEFRLDRRGDPAGQQDAGA